MVIKLYSKDGSQKGNLQIPESLVSKKAPSSLVYEALRAYGLNQRTGRASTKTRAEVSGGSKKPWKQKHTGNARAGSIRSPLWRKGGIVFGPKPKDWSVALPKAQKRLAALSVFVEKAKAGEISAVEDFELDNFKTKSITQILKKLNLGPSVLFGDSKISENILLAARNLPEVTYKLAKDFNIYELARSKNVLVSKSGFEQLIKQFENI